MNNFAQESFHFVREAMGGSFLYLMTSAVEKGVGFPVASKVENYLYLFARNSLGELRDFVEDRVWIRIFDMVKYE